MSENLPLDERIVAVLTKPCTASEAAEVYVAAEAALTEMGARADEADAASLSPLATRGNAAELRGRANELRFEADRLEASVAALSARVATLSELEKRTAESEERAAALAERDELAADIREHYPRLAAELAVLVHRIVQSDARMAAGRIYEASAEAIARGVPGNFANVGRLQDIHLPMLNSPKTAWRLDCPNNRLEFPAIEEYAHVMVRALPKAEAA